MGEFESRFLFDLEDGKLSNKESYFDLEGNSSYTRVSFWQFIIAATKLEIFKKLIFLCFLGAGELWMNLDGDISPICLNIFPLVATSMK